MLPQEYCARVGLREMEPAMGRKERRAFANVAASEN